MIITEIQYFSSKIIRFQAIFKDTVEFTCALEFKISSQQILFLKLHELFLRNSIIGLIRAVLSCAHCIIVVFQLKR